ncbi:hypothetical protein E2562_025565 [Oryza meyeriana var. granulata]|uniref:Uncharacterized protein n=1 Tax=Oryza meyeriana var. granulata TaxID=110450 RepID=A0A6G1FCB9_9ORYZ|nr:hypothetical protein E2562_025565 [Oryza meyeriana var. granulata]
MDKLTRSQGGAAVAGGERTVREFQYYYHGGGLVDQEMGVAAPSEAADDGVVLLMELLDEDEMEDDYDSPAPAATGGSGADRLSRVIRSLEAEIGMAAAPASATRDDSYGSTAAGLTRDDDSAAGISRLEDMFSDDLDAGYGGGLFGYSWPPELALPAAAHEVGGWCVYSDEHLYYGDGSVDEQVYSPFLKGLFIDLVLYKWLLP